MRQAMPGGRGRRRAVRSRRETAAQGLAHGDRAAADAHSRSVRYIVAGSGRAGGGGVPGRGPAFLRPGAAAAAAPGAPAAGTCGARGGRGTPHLLASGACAAVVRSA